MKTSASAPSSRDVYNSFERLVDDLAQRDSDPGTLHRCPQCGGQAHIHFSVATSSVSGVDKLAVDIACEKCQIAIAMDGGGPIPPWAKRASGFSCRDMRGERTAPPESGDV